MLVKPNSSWSSDYTGTHII